MLQAARQGGAGVLGSLLAHWQQHACREVILCECGQRMSSRGRRVKRLVTTLGRVPFGRSFYQCDRCHQGRFPDDERLDIVQTTYSPGVRRLMARAGSQTQFEQAAEDLLCYAGLELDPREIERVAEEVGRQVEQWLSAEQEQILHTASRLRPPWPRTPNSTSASTAPVFPFAKVSWWDGAASKPTVQPAPAKPSWAVCSPKWVWIKRAVHNAIRTRPPMSEPLNVTTQVQTAGCAG